ncbi:MAG: M12 family metallo-peptidase [Xanthomonadales bacterium]|nr:M12 family metallo-peptidase [Xanthomonadales bacterium]
MNKTVFSLHAVLILLASVCLAPAMAADGPAERSLWRLAGDRAPALDAAEANLAANTESSPLPLSVLPPMRHAITGTVAAPAPGSRVAVDLPEGHRVHLWMQEVARHRDGAVTLAGQADGHDHALLTFGAGGVFGDIHAAGSRYMVSTEADGTWLLRLDDPRLGIDTCGHDHFAAPAELPVPAAAPNGAGTVQLDVMIVYPPAMAARYPGFLLPVRLNHLVAVANQAMVNSQLDVVVRLVHQQQLADPPSADNFDVLLAMRQALAGAGQPPFAELAQLRAAHGADLVVWTWPHDIDTRGSCGVAYLPDNSSGGYDASAGVHITNDGSSNWSVCSNDVFTHELGHNLGAVHQSFPGAPDSPAYAWVVPGRFNTVMGSFGSNQADRFRRLAVFSNPDILCGGAPCGSSTPGAQANQALVINTLAPIVAGYASATVPGQATPPPPSDPDSDGDGVSDWLDPYPFDPYDNDPPPQPPLPPFSPLALLPGTSPDQLQLLVANSGNDQVLAFSADGRPMGLVAQAVATNPRPLISEHSDLDVDGDGRLVLLANGDVQHYSRERGQFLGTWLGSFNDGTPPVLHNGFPRAMGFNLDRSQLVVIGDYSVERFAPDGTRLNITTAPADATDPENWNNYMPLPLRAFAFGAGNRFYLADSLGNRIMRFDTVSGARLGDASAASPGLIQDPRDLVVGPDGALYLADGDSDRVLRFPADGSSAGSVFVAAGAGGLSFARALAFGPDGHLYVASRDDQRILRYHGSSGGFLDVFIDGAGLDGPESIRFTPKLDLIFRDGLQGP